MKTTWIIGAMAAAAMAAQAERASPAVTVYTRCDPGVPKLVQLEAQRVAGRIFADIGVPVRWREGGPPQIAEGKAGVMVPIRLLNADASGAAWPGALAVTRPQETGPAIDIFYRRVAVLYRTNLSGVMLGYVLAHEMAHVLEGGARHSAEGILKAYWTRSDLARMAAGRLEFAEYDVMLIRRWVVAKTAELQLLGRR